MTQSSAPPGDPPHGPSVKPSGPAWPVLLFTAAILAGLIPRLILILQGKINSDEAIVGLMGMEILKGHHTAFYWGQGYMGSLEAYLAALLFALFGPSPETLKLAPFLFFLAAVWLHARVAARLFDPLTARLTLIFLFCSSWVFTVWSFAPRGGYMTALALGGGALLLGLRLEERGGGDAGDNLLMGVLWGLGLWTHFFFAYYIIPLALLVVVPALGRPGRFRRLASLTAGFVLGALPLLVWNLRHDLGSFRLKKIAARLDLWGNLHNLAERQLPYLLGGNPLTGRTTLWPPLLWLLLAVWAAAGGWYLYRAGRGFARREPLRRPALLVPGVALTALAFFLGTGFGGLDTQRYLLPVYPVAAIALGAFAAHLWRRRALLAGGLVLFVIGVNLWGILSFAVTKGVPEGRAQKRDAGALLDFCRKEGVTTAWGGHWTCYLLTFLSRGELTVADVERDRHPPLQRLVEESSDASLIVEGDTADFGAALASSGLRWVEERSGPWTVFAHPRPDPALGPFDRRAPLDVIGTGGGVFERLPGGGVRTVSAQAQGDSVTLSLGKGRSANGLVLVPGEESGEYPRRLRVETSLDGSAWEPASPIGPAVGGVYWDGRIRWDRSGTVTVRFPPRPAAFLRVTLGRPSKDRRWSIEKALAGVADGG
jgi:4-amino-4-deoxy-L-arabinose transferase-like glycosyltransferase